MHTREAATGVLAPTNHLPGRKAAEVINDFYRFSHRVSKAHEKRLESIVRRQCMVYDVIYEKTKTPPIVIIMKCTPPNPFAHKNHDIPSLSHIRQGRGSVRCSCPSAPSVSEKYEKKVEGESLCTDHPVEEAK